MDIYKARCYSMGHLRHHGHQWQHRLQTLAQSLGHGPQIQPMNINTSSDGAQTMDNYLAFGGNMCH